MRMKRKKTKRGIWKVVLTGETVVGHGRASEVEQPGQRHNRIHQHKRRIEVIDEREHAFVEERLDEDHVVLVPCRPQPLVDGVTHRRRAGLCQLRAHNSALG